MTDAWCMYLLLKVDGYAAAPFVLALTTPLLWGTLTLSTIMWQIPLGLYLLKREIFQQFLFSTLMCAIDFVSINGRGMKIHCKIKCMVSKLIPEKNFSPWVKMQCGEEYFGNIMIDFVMNSTKLHLEKCLLNYRCWVTIISDSGE